MSRGILTAKNLGKSFGGIHALKEINLTIHENEIHCFAGMNGSGKSTFIKCVSGIYEPDCGEIILNGKTYSHLTPQEAISEGIQVIYQDLSLFPHLTIAENIAINKIMNQGKRLVNWKEIYSVASAQLEKIGVEMDLNDTIQESTMANCQLTAICRALAMDAKLIFMDEPTTALTAREVKRLLAVVMDLKKKGYAIVFISHKLDEIFDVADKITVFRDGQIVGNFESSSLDKKKLTQYMTGSEVEYHRYVRTCREDTPVLTVDHLSQKDNYTDISFSVRPGDILGLTGLLGSGRTELGLTLFGLNQHTSGTIMLEGKEIKRPTPEFMRKQGVGLLPENRSVQGLFAGKSIRQNLSSASLSELTGRLGILDVKKEEQLAEKMIADMNVKAASMEAPVETLSGGNQQKTVIGKWIAGNPRLFIMDAPTVGIDVGSKAEIYDKIQYYASKGMAILLISDEIEEIICNCNRILVMAQGKQVAMIEEEERLATDPALLEEKIMRLMSEEKRPDDELGAGGVS
ncbi:MAG: sugar ABC transporter ATP-binding protein [Eubacteriales bacterium]|nr:sugar ABC transporter ATP-binding protein [Eubacteriales bacterium]